MNGDAGKKTSAETYGAAEDLDAVCLADGALAVVRLAEADGAQRERGDTNEQEDPKGSAKGG